MTIGMPVVESNFWSKLTMFENHFVHDLLDFDFVTFFSLLLFLRTR